MQISYRILCTFPYYNTYVAHMLYINYYVKKYILGHPWSDIRMSTLKKYLSDLSIDSEMYRLLSNRIRNNGYMKLDAIELTDYVMQLSASANITVPKSLGVYMNMYVGYICYIYTVCVYVYIYLHTTTSITVPKSLAQYSVQLSCPVLYCTVISCLISLISSILFSFRLL